MSRSQTWQSRSSHPNAPNITHHMYDQEKVYYSGAVISSMLYGIIIALFFQCMAALFNPVYRRGERIKWGLVSYTLVMFSVVTVQNAMDLNLQSIANIDNREFPGHGKTPPGPVGYQWFTSRGPLNDIPTALFTLTNWLADGFLLYRCFIVYSKNFWVIAFPCLMFLGSLAMGIMFVYQDAGQIDGVWSALPWFTISLSLNILLTLMIVVRLILHTRSCRTALGITGIGGLCKAIITMLVESCALYAVGSALLIGSLGGDTYVANFFLFILPETQVIAPLLIIRRVAEKSAFASNTLASGRIGGLETRTRGGLTDGGDVLPGGNPTGLVDTCGEDSSEREGGVETGIDSHCDTA